MAIHLKCERKSFVGDVNETNSGIYRFSVMLVNAIRGYKIAILFAYFWEDTI